MAEAAALPTGVVTFLFTDVEGSTQLLNAHPDAYRAAVTRHHDLLAEAVQVNTGVVFETVGDAVYAAFARPTDAVAAALWGQLALQAEDWGPTPIRVRMALHRENVAALRALEATFLFPYILELWASVATRLQAPAHALRLHGAAQAARAASGRTAAGWWQSMAAQSVAEARAALDPAAADAAFEAGTQWSLDDALDRVMPGPAAVGSL